MSTINWTDYSSARSSTELSIVRYTIFLLEDDTRVLQEAQHMLVTYTKSTTRDWVRLRGRADGLLALYSFLFGWAKGNTGYGFPAYGSLSAGVASEQTVRRFKALIHKAEVQLRKLKKLTETIGKQAVYAMQKGKS